LTFCLSNNRQVFSAGARSDQQDVEEGSTLAAAMARHAKVFDQLYSNMVEAGETGGILDLILQSSHLHRKDRQAKTRRRLRDDLSVAVILLAVVAVAVIMIVVIPQFQTIFLGLLGR